MDLPGKKRILSVDDSLDNAELLGVILGEERYEVETAQSTSKAWQLAQTGQFDLYALDLRFSDGTHGFDLIKRIRAIDRLTPIVVCSADVREVVQEEAMQIGAQAFLRKPIDIDELIKTIALLLGDE